MASSSSSGPSIGAKHLPQASYSGKTDQTENPAHLSLLEALPQEVLERLYSVRKNNGKPILKERDLAQIAGTSRTLYSSRLEAAKHQAHSQTLDFVNILIAWARQIPTLSGPKLEALENLSRSLEAEFHCENWTELRDIQPKLLDRLMGLFIKDLSDELLQLLQTHIQANGLPNDFKHFDEILTAYRNIKREIAAPNPQPQMSGNLFKHTKLRTFGTFCAFCSQHGLFQTSVDVALCFPEADHNESLGQAYAKFTTTLANFFETKKDSTASCSRYALMRCLDACIQMPNFEFRKKNKTSYLKELYDKLSIREATELQKIKESEKTSPSLKTGISQTTPDLILREVAAKIVLSLFNARPSVMDDWFLHHAAGRLAHWGYCDEAHLFFEQIQNTEYREWCIGSLIRGNIQCHNFDRATALMEHVKSEWECQSYWQELFKECVNSENFTLATQLIERIDNPQTQDECRALLANGFAKKNDFASAIQVANSITKRNSSICYADIFEIFFKQNRFAEALSFVLEIKDSQLQSHFLTTVLNEAVRKPGDRDALWDMHSSFRYHSESNPDESAETVEKKQDLEAITDFIKNIPDEQWLLLTKAMLPFVERMTCFSKKDSLSFFQKNSFDLETQDKILSALADLWKKIPACDVSEFVEQNGMQCLKQRLQIEKLFDLFWENDFQDQAINVANFLSSQKNLQGADKFFIKAAQLTFESGRMEDGLRYTALISHDFLREGVLETVIDQFIQAKDYPSAIKYIQHSNNSSRQLENLFNKLLKNNEFDLIFQLAPLCPENYQEILLERAIYRLIDKHRYEAAWTHIQGLTNETKKKRFSTSLLRTLVGEHYLQSLTRHLSAEENSILQLILNTYPDLTTLTPTTSSSSRASSSSGPTRPSPEASYRPLQNWITQQLRSEHYLDVADLLVNIQNLETAQQLLTCLFHFTPRVEKWLNENNLDYVTLNEEQSRSMLNALEALPPGERKKALLLKIDPAYTFRKDQVIITDLLNAGNYDTVAQHLLSITDRNLRKQLLDNLFHLLPDTERWLQANKVSFVKLNPFQRQEMLRALERLPESEERRAMILHIDPCYEASCSIL
jgi:hypothetical protein